MLWVKLQPNILTFFQSNYKVKNQETCLFNLQMDIQQVLKALFSLKIQVDTQQVLSSP